MDDESFKFLVIVVVAILVVSLVINAFLATDLQSFSSPPLRTEGYITESGDPMPGYYIVTDTNAAPYRHASEGLTGK